MSEAISIQKRKIYSWMIIFLLMGLFLGAWVGFALGNYFALNWAVGKAVYFLNLEGVRLDMDEAEIVRAMDQYKEHLDAYYPEQNAFIYNNSRDKVGS